MRMVFRNESGGTLAAQNLNVCPSVGDTVSLWGSESLWTVQCVHFAIHQNAHDSYVRVTCKKVAKISAVPFSKTG